MSDDPKDKFSRDELDDNCAPWMTSKWANILDPLSFVQPTFTPQPVRAKWESTTLNTDLISKYGKFQDEVADLRKQVRGLTVELSQQKMSAQEKEDQNEKLRLMNDELHAKERIRFLLDRVNSSAKQELLASEAFRDKFLGTKECDAVVMSVDIRRSTELMLRARTPEAFAEFITCLCSDLVCTITDKYGVFDKFTGDGVLAFFPDFFSSSDAAYYAVSAADRCHSIFREHYQRFRTSFSSVLTSTGLGIGIDYGPVHLVQLADSLTVVGKPVVYACRLSAAPPGKTFVNQPAYELICEKFAAYCFLDEKTIDIKHEGEMLAYEVRPNDREYKPERPAWLTPSGTNTE